MVTLTATQGGHMTQDTPTIPRTRPLTDTGSGGYTDW
jgi:hypothetical protein